MELIERIGAFLGLAAFLGLGVLALLYFQQGREVRRLRDWAGRAPERAAAAAAEAEAALSGTGAEAEAEGGPSLRERARARWEGSTRRLPDGVGERLPAPRYLGLIALVAVVIGVGAATGGFGLLGGDDATKRNRGAKPAPSSVEVAVLNSTGVTGLAAEVGDDVEKLDYKVGAIADIGTPFGETVVMYEDGHETEADQVAKDVSQQLGKTSVQKMSGEVADQADGASVAIVIGQDDAQL